MIYLKMQDKGLARKSLEKQGQLLTSSIVFRLKINHGMVDDR